MGATCQLPSHPPQLAQFLPLPGSTMAYSSIECPAVFPSKTFVRNQACRNNETSLLVCSLC